MFQFRDLLGAHFSARAGAHAFDAIRLPTWLERRLHWNAASDERHHRRVERSAQKPPVGKDAKTDW